MKTIHALIPLVLLLSVCAHAAPIVFEAEHANDLDAVFLVDEDAGCSGGLCIMVPDDAAEPAGLKITGARKSYTIDVGEEGTYDAWFRVYWTHACANSFWISINGGVQQKVTDAAFSEWHWLKGPAARMKKGRNVLALSNREDGAYVDQIALTRQGRTLVPAKAVLKPTVISADPDTPPYRVFFQLPIRQRFVWDGRTKETAEKLGSEVALRGKPAGREIFIAPGLPADIAAWIRSNGLKKGSLSVLVNVPKDVRVNRKDRFTVSLKEGSPLTKVPFRVSCTDALPRGTRAMQIHFLQGSRVVSSEIVHVTRPFDWALCGPFASEGTPRPDTSGVDAAAPWSAPVGDRTWVRPLPGKYLGLGGSVDVLRVFGKGTRACAFACTRIDVAKDGEYEFLIENDDQIFVWIDGSIIYRNQKAGPAGRSRTLVKTTLAKGVHTILLKIFQKERHWEFKVAPVTPGVIGLPFANWKE